MKTLIITSINSEELQVRLINYANKSKSRIHHLLIEYLIIQLSDICSDITISGNLGSNKIDPKNDILIVYHPPQNFFSKKNSEALSSFRWSFAILTENYNITPWEYNCSFLSRYTKFFSTCLDKCSEFENGHYFDHVFAYEPDTKILDTPIKRPNTFVWVTSNKLYLAPDNPNHIKKSLLKAFNHRTDGSLFLYGHGWQERPRLIGLTKGNFVSIAKAIAYRIQTTFWRTPRRYRGEVDDKIHTLLPYEFALVIENSHEILGYITEKIFDAARAHCIPVFWGNEHVYTQFPSDCIVNIEDFASIDECINYCLSLTSDKKSTMRKSLAKHLKKEITEHQLYSPPTQALKISQGIKRELEQLQHSSNSDRPSHGPDQI